MKFIELLQSSDDLIEAEVITRCCGGLESKYSFSWCPNWNFTEYGRLYFQAILESEITMRLNAYGLVITLQNPDITEDLYNRFMATQAGYVKTSFYYKVIERV